MKTQKQKEVKKRNVNSHIVRVYYAICNQENFKIQEEELSEVKWFNIDEVINMIKNNDDSLTLKSESWLKLLEKLKMIV